MFLGRAIYGLGGESITVTSSAILSTWFGNGKEIALAFGINLSVSRLVSVFNATSSAPIHGIVCCHMDQCLFFLAASIVLFYIDRQSTRKIRQQQKK